METSNNTELMSRSEAARYIGVRPSTLACWCSTRRYHIPIVRVGRLVRYLKSDLDLFLQSRRDTLTGEVQNDQ